ncbi:flagellar assembly protein A [Pseudoduganella namucuonensis]|uniref:flagellar assembly protein A n=1 Tax=Pseudoduganella namucuonensis TaxID=1035707 RepID=UPI003530FC1C
MSNDVQAAEAPAGGELPSSLVQRADGVYFRGDATAAASQAAVNHVFLGNGYFTGLDYAVFIRALYNAGAELPDNVKGKPLIRFADGIAPFPPERRELYKSVKIINGEAEYYFEPVFFFAPDMPPQPARLIFEEFVADMWVKGIRFGIDAPAVRATIAAGRVTRLIAARRLAATPGRDAAIVEVSQSLHRSNAPREMANGRFDLNTFQNRFPQVPPHVKLLRKVPMVAGIRGYELSGIPLEAPQPRDIDLASVAGPGTLVETVNGVEFLVSAVEGFISVDGSKKISIGPKIISREGVSVRTTGNLQLTGEYEEFGEVQEQRSVDGGSITIHGDVYGNINSRGGVINLQRNLMGGAATNVDGHINVKGVASNAVLQTKQGDVVLGRAESCIISGTRVVIGEASNCEIMADEVVIKNASGCAIAARRIEIGSAGPRKQIEMLLFPMVPDTAKYDKAIAEYEEKAARHGAVAARHKADIDAITNEPDVRNYLTLATRVRKQEVVLTPEQLALFQKMAVQVGPALRSVGKLSLSAKEAQGLQAQTREQAAAVLRQKEALLGEGRCVVKLVEGETVVRTMLYNPDHGAAYDLAPREIKSRLRATASRVAAIFSGSSGSVDWRAVPAQ